MLSFPPPPPTHLSQLYASIYIQQAIHRHITPFSDKPPWSRLLAPGVFKPTCSTPFTVFLRLDSVYRPFQLYFIPKTLHNTSVFSSLLTAYFYLTGHSPAILLHLSTTQLSFIEFFLLSAVTFRPSVFAVRCIPCRGRMRSWWLRSPVTSNTLLRPGFPLDGWLGWPDPINRLVVLCSNFD